MLKCKWKFHQKISNKFSFIFYFNFKNRTQAPKKDIYYPQESIQAECKVTGMPIPIVEWVQGTEMRDVS